MGIVGNVGYTVNVLKMKFQCQVMMARYNITNAFNITSDAVTSK